MATELITTEYAGPASRQVGTLPCYDVRAWWTVRDGRTEGHVKLSAGHELKRHVRADHVEFVHMDMDTYGSPRINAMITFRVLTHEQFAARAELRTRVYKNCDGDGCTREPGQLVRMDADKSERALCYTCWKPLCDAGACQVLHWIKSNGRVQA
jgi:hypothetical protein